ncbi:hypothetical protein ACW23B_03970 [Streptomyces albidoflavus]
MSVSTARRNSAAASRLRNRPSGQPPGPVASGRGRRGPAPSRRSAQGRPRLAADGGEQSWARVGGRALGLGLFQQPQPGGLFEVGGVQSGQGGLRGRRPGQRRPERGVGVAVSHPAGRSSSCPA